MRNMGERLENIGDSKNNYLETLESERLFTNQEQKSNKEKLQSTEQQLRKYEGMQKIQDDEL